MGDGKTERGSASLSVVYSIDLHTEKFYNDMKKEYLKNINSAFDILQMMWKHPIEKLERTNYYQKCTPNMNIDNYEVWKERRNLYEYYVNLDTLSKTAQRSDNVCEAYYKKIEGTKSLYKYFENKCSSDKYDCPYFYKNYMHYNLQNVLTNLPCHQLIKSKSADTLEDLSLTHFSGQELGHGSSSYDTDPTSERSDIGTKVGHLVLGVAPVLLTATALYTYTTIGSWIRNISGNNANSISKDAGEIEGFLANT
ncbi:PIR Superfamily Protein [Plasmodium ovale wallikeri]|uniref:PIR Superfamily Protein n=1 Tax=Plasmodium ovale wallikeri TaxID=864142 RepID=A0A1A9ASV3_PLAOA|nr:PIR Superfamily Protein [Plasmodium ovale wallikeri]SBT59205.1 PIR Superfamily Protein [Plasmodium ovale wallikeri]